MAFSVITPPLIVRLLRNLSGGYKMTADDSTHVNIETGNRIPIGGYLFSETGSSFISAVD